MTSANPSNPGPGSPSSTASGQNQSASSAKESGSESRSKTLADRINHPWPIALLLALAGIIGAWNQVSGMARDVWHSAFAPRWPETEYSKIARIHIGLGLNTVTAVFGAPSRSISLPADETGPKIPVRENDFIERGYWIQVFTNSDDAVVQLSVLGCDPGFEPKLSLPADIAARGSIQLGATFVGLPLGGTLFMNTPGSNAPSYTEEFDTAMVDDQRGYLVGGDYSCSPTPNMGKYPVPDNFRCTAGPWTWSWVSERSLPICSSRVDMSAVVNFRAHLTINSWAECSGACIRFPGTVNTRGLPLPYFTAKAG